MHRRSRPPDSALDKLISERDDISVRLSLLMDSGDRSRKSEAENLLQDLARTEQGIKERQRLILRSYH